MFTHWLQSCLPLFFSEPSPLYTQLQLMANTTADCSTAGTLSFPLISFFKIFTHNNQNHLQLISRYESSSTDSSSFCLFLCSLSSLSSLFSPKHSYLDQETSLILKSIAGKPTHLLTKVTSSQHTHFFPLIHAHCFSLLLFACFKFGNIHALTESDQATWHMPVLEFKYSSVM